MSNKYSYSKLGAYQSCPLSYDLQYVRGIKIPKEYSYDIAKGIIFHKYAEVYRGDADKALAEAFSQPELKPEHILRITPEQRLSIQNAFNSYNRFYDFTLKTKEQYIEREFNITDTTPAGKPFTGFLDLLIREPGNYWVIDYKTSKSADTSLYSNQLYTYIHFISKKYNIGVKDIKAAIFFPFVDGEQLKPVRVAPKKVEEQITKLDNYITEIESPQRLVDAKLQWLCSYCSYQGIQELCPASVIAGARPVRHFNEATQTVA